MGAQRLRLTRSQQKSSEAGLNEFLFILFEGPRKLIYYYYYILLVQMLYRHVSSIEIVN